MNNFAWSLVESTAELLESEQRDAVLGDLAEAGENAWQSLLDILGLVFRRQAALWNNWRPWVAAFGVSVPASFLLMGVSLSVSRIWLQMVDRSAVFILMSQALLLIGWSWSGGYVVAALSRRTLWINAVLCCSPCLFCLARFRVPFLSRFCLLLFLLPAIFGVLQGLRRMQIKPGFAAGFALSMMLLMVATWSGGGQLRSLMSGAALSWPAWYLVRAARENETT